MTMRNLFYILIILTIFSSCRQNNVNNNTPSVTVTEDSNEGILVAEGIIYDVIVKAEKDDPWLKEMVKGYREKEFVDGLFESVYAGEVEVSDYHSGERLSTKEIKKLEDSDEYNRDRIGKIQFTEDWYYNPSTHNMQKKIRSVVFGYRIDPNDLNRTGYLAAFRIDFKP